MTALIILGCVVIGIGFALEVAIGGGGGAECLPPPDGPPPTPPPSE